MKKSLFTLIIATMTSYHSAPAQQLNFAKVKSTEHQLDDVMELIDTTVLKLKLQDVEKVYTLNPSEINKARLGIIYHETALNLGFFSKTEYKGYAQKSYEVLSELLNSPNTIPELLPFITSYRASALALVGAETRKLKLLGKAFVLFNDAVNKYSTVSYCPEFMRGSVSENLPWFMFKKRSYAKKDFISIISKYEADNAFATAKIMSFTYWAWANQHQSKKDRTNALAYLDKAIELDPNYNGGRKRAEDLKFKLLK